MPEINVVAAPVTNGLAPASNAASADASAANPFAAILLQQQMADPVGQALLAAKTNLTLAATTDPLPVALNTLLPMLLGGSGLNTSASVGRDAIALPATAKDDSDKPEIPTVDMLLAMPVTAPLTSSPNVTSAAAVSADPPNTASTAPALPAPMVATAANLAATANVVAAAATAAQPAAKEQFEAMLAPSTDARTQAAVAQAAATLAHAVPVASVNSAQAHVDNPVGTPAWNNDIGDHMVWMANQGQSRAELVLTPPQLGRIEISLSMSGDQANAVFVAASPEVREALENAMPRLREILADAGVTLAQTQVGADSSGQSANYRENGDNSSQGRGSALFGDSTASAALAASATSPWLRTGRGMVDVFA